MIQLRDSAKRVQDHLITRGFAFEVKELPGSTRTAQEAADSIGCAVAQIAKSLVFRDKANNHPILVIASGTNRVDLKKIKKTTGLKLDKVFNTGIKDLTLNRSRPFHHGQQHLELLNRRH